MPATSGPVSRQLLPPEGIVSLPGVYDPLSARLAEEAGFHGIYLSGYSLSAALLGKPDAGILTGHQVAERIRTIREVTGLPLLADADTGFGGLHNVRQTVRDYERAGASALQIEDQEFPKRCGHTRNRRVIPTADMVDKVKVAVDSRTSEDFLVVARTDARTEHGLDAALARAGAYLEAGADVLFVESPESEAEMRAICAAFPGTPLLANMVGGGRTPLIPDAELETLGYRIVIHPIYGIGAAVAAVAAAYRTLRESGSEDPGAASIDVLNNLVGFPEVWALDEAYARD